MSLIIQKQLPANQSNIILSRKPFSWLDHAKRHFKDGYISHNDCIIPVDEALMYLCLFSYVGMFSE